MTCPKCGSEVIAVSSRSMVTCFVCGKVLRYTVPVADDSPAAIREILKREATQAFEAHEAGLHREAARIRKPLIFKLLKRGQTVEFIAKRAKCSVKYVKELRREYERQAQDCPCHAARF